MKHKYTYAIAGILIAIFIIIQWLIGFKGELFSDYHWYCYDQLAECLFFVVCVLLFPNWFKVPAFAIAILSFTELIDQVLYENTKVHLADYLAVFITLLGTVGFIIIRLYVKRKNGRIN